MDVIFSSTEQGCEFERRVGDSEQFGKPQGIIWGQGIRAPCFFGYFLWGGQQEVTRHKGEIRC